VLVQLLYFSNSFTSLDRDPRPKMIAVFRQSDGPVVCVVAPPFDGPAGAGG